MKNYKLLGLLSVISLLFVMTNCSEPYIPPTSQDDQQFVIEGFVEAGENTFPVYVLITKSIPFISEVGQETFESIFVSDADVRVTDGDKEVQLTQLCANDPNLPDVFKEAVAAFFGIEISEMAPNICVYVDILDQITKEIGRSYDLQVTIGEEVMTATTTIPRHIPLENIKVADTPGDGIDTLAKLNVTVSDPVGRDYHRYVSGIGDRGYTPPFTSVTDDAFFDGDSFEFPLDRASYPDEDFDFATVGFWPRGDTARIKWMNLDKVHFDFWNTRDFAANSGGPFSNYTRIAGNVDGALGIWGGYSISEYVIPIPPK
jgi:hypothetical protein